MRQPVRFFCSYASKDARLVSGLLDLLRAHFKASASFDYTAWEFRELVGESVLTLEGHRGGVRACAVSPDGRRIVTGSYDNTLRVWDAATGAPLLTIARFNDGSEAVFDESPRRLRHATPGAWRYLGWLAPDPVTGFLTRYPAESFGPLPGAE